VVLGGGYVGLYTSLTLLKRLRQGEAQVTVIDPRSYMTYQPFLPEASAGSLSARDVVVPLRRVLKGAEIINAHVTAVDHSRRCVAVQPLEGPGFEVPYDVVVVALGSIARTLPIPGLAETGVGFKTVEEAIYLRNHVLHCLDVAASTKDAARRRCALTFVFIGGGYAGIEAFAEIEDMAQYALGYYPSLLSSELRFVLVEASNRILPEVAEDMGRYTVDELRQRGMEVLLQTRLESCVEGHVALSDGQRFDADTLVWTAGVKASPVLSDTDLPLDDKGRLRCDANLRVRGVADAWGAGDLTRPGAFCSPSAQHAVRQARRLGKNIVASLRGGEVKDYRHAYAGSVASLGLYKGVAQVYGVKLRGWPAWFMHRTYHVSRMPTLNRKVRVLSDWTLALFFKREIVSLGEMDMPRGEFLLAAESSSRGVRTSGSGGTGQAVGQ